MDFFVWQRTCVDDAGNVLASASVTVTDAVSGALATLYSDEGSTGIGNPVTADADGFVQFYVKAGFYNVTATSGASSRTWTKEAIGAPHKRTPAEISAGVTPVDYRYPEGTIDRYGVNTGTTDMAAAITAALSVGKDVYGLPGSTYAVNSGVTVSSVSDLTVDLRGSTITAGANNLVLISFTSCSRIRVKNGVFTGDGTASAIGNGMGLKFTNCDDVTVEGNRFTNFGGGSARFDGTSSTHRGFRFWNNVCEDNPFAVGGTAGAEVHFAGALQDIDVSHNTFVADATTPHTKAVLVANGTSLNWRDFRATHNYCEGYTRGGIYTTDEDHEDALFDNGEVYVAGNMVRDCEQEGIKIKASGRVVVTGNIVVDCDQEPELAGNLQGAIHVNNRGIINVSDNIVIGATNNGIQAIGLTGGDGSYSTGAGRSGFVISGNIIDDVTGGTAKVAGIWVPLWTYELVCSSNVVLNADRGIWIDGTSAATDDDKPASITLSANEVRFGTADSDGAGIQLTSVRLATLQGNRVRDMDGFGCSATGCDEVSIIGDQYLDNGQGGFNTHGLRLSGCDGVRVIGVRAGNHDSTDQTHGISFGGTNTNVIIHGCDFTGNATAAHSGLPDDAMLGANLGFWTTDVSFDDGDATPSVKNRTMFKTANTTATTITTFDDSAEGQVIRVIINDANTTIDFTGTNLKGNGGADWSPTTGDHMTCAFDGTNWYCDISDNTA
jgi:hypothetical protein